MSLLSFIRRLTMHPAEIDESTDDPPPETGNEIGDYADLADLAADGKKNAAAPRPIGERLRGSQKEHCDNLTDRHLDMKANETVPLPSPSDEQLRHAQKMEAFGQLAGGIAHDFNNMLSIILGAAQLIEMEINSREVNCLSAPGGGGYAGIRRNIDIVIDTSKKASDLTRQLLTFAHKGNYKVVQLEMHEAIRGVVGLLNRTFDKRIRIIERLHAPFSTVMGDYALLQNALLNLAINARDAMPDGGMLTFATDVIFPRDKTSPAQPIEVQRGSYLRIKVADTGIGMDEKTKKRAFEPFFTTKGPGKGTGLGLASVYGTVKNHNGLIELESESNVGTTFSIFLPLAAQPRHREAARPEIRKKGVGKILIVDDEEDIRTILGDILCSLGYQVFSCIDGMDAVEYYSKHFGEIDVVIVDMIMPRMGGYDCIKCLKKINPQAKILVSSGYTLVSDTQKIITRGIAGYIQKPFEITELSQTLSELLTKG